MARTTVTEESLGLAPTEDEMTASPAIEADEDISLGEAPPEEPEKSLAQPEKAKAGEPEKAEPAKPADEGKTVDLRALQEARAEAREAKRQAAVLEQRWNDFFAGQNAPKQPVKEETPIPKWNEDPVAAGAWTQEQLIALREQQETQRREQEDRAQQEAAYQQAFQQVDRDFTEAAQADPTIVEAYKALMDSQGRELVAMGYTVPQAQQTLRDLERQHVQFVAARGMNIGEYIKSLATARGWSPRATPPAAVPEKPKADLAAIADAQRRHQSLSDAPGGEAPPALDAKALARMSDREFKAWMSQKGNDAKFEEIMGKG